MTITEHLDFIVIDLNSIEYDQPIDTFMNSISLMAELNEECFWEVHLNNIYMLTDYGYDGIKELYKNGSTKCAIRDKGKNGELRAAFKEIQKEVDIVEQENLMMLNHIMQGLKGLTTLQKNIKLKSIISYIDDGYFE